ncbi:uncharacterized protein LOC115762890 [Drosophila novamexicana]|uniref:uncharacterized protein LOC115762890 n=1 Tax=Drosophila novamexicana TaxID=47314 RepID=UPI0011E5A64B|nr:uncharacterized protein LOC115762890 [Drosophila novamexicana]
MSASGSNTHNIATATVTATVTSSGITTGTGTGSGSSSSHIFRSLSSESQKREWSKRLSLRGMRHGGAGAASLATSKEESMSAGVAASGKHRKFFSRSASLKQAGSGGGSTQASMELHVPGHSSAAGSPSGLAQPQPLTQPSTPKKSNWEVIEHFNTSAKGGKAMVSSSLIAAGITRCNIDESIDSTNSSSTCHSPMIYQRDEAQLLQQSDGRSNVEANNPSTTGTQAASPSISFWYRLNRIILRLCSTHQFKNLQVEMLYQRYFLRMNQSNTTHILALLLALILALSCTQIVFTTLQLRRSQSTDTGLTSATIRLAPQFLDANRTSENLTHFMPELPPPTPQQMSHQTVSITTPTTPSAAQIPNSIELPHARNDNGAQRPTVAASWVTGRRQKRKHYRRMHKHRYKQYQHRVRYKRAAQPLFTDIDRLNAASVDVVAIVDDDGDDGVKRFTEERNNNEIRRRLSFSGSRQARDEVPKLTLFDGDANGTDQEQKEEVPEAQTESGLLFWFFSL